MRRVIYTRSPIWKWIAFVGIVVGLLSSALPNAAPVEAAVPTSSGSVTFQCNDGSSNGISGYTRTSSCASYRRAWDCSHRDRPQGPMDTLTCTNVPDTKCLRFTTTMRYKSRITVGDIVDTISPFQITLPEGIERYLNRFLTANDPIAYGQLKGRWCVNTPDVTSYQIYGVFPDTTDAAPPFIRVRTLKVGSISKVYYQNTPGSYYNIIGTEVGVYISSPVDFSIGIPGTDLSMQIKRGDYLIDTMDSNTILQRYGNAYCTAPNKSPCTVEAFLD